MQIHHGRAGVALFTIAAPGVNSVGLGLLARHMSEDLSVYKIQAPGPVVLGRPYEQKELRTLAREYISAMRAVQPRGPFCLGGMCEGVQIAQEMILQLEAEGEQVALFAIFDTWVLENSQVRLLWVVDYYLGRIRKFPQLRSEEQRATLQRLLQRVTRRNTLPKSGWGKRYWPDEMFKPPRFRAPVILFKRSRQPYYYIRDAEMGWGARSVSGVEICEMNCGHIEVLREPHVRLVAQKLSARLKEINTRAEGHTLTFRSPQNTIPLNHVISSRMTDPAIGESAT